MNVNVEDWRSKIDAIDTALLHLLNLRTEWALEIGKLKSSQGSEMRVPSREEKILNRMRSANPGPLDDDAIVKIYQLIFDESKRMQDLHCLGKADSADGRPPRTAGRKPARR